MGNLIERVNHNFCLVRSMINQTEHPEAYRIMHFIPSWYFLYTDTEESARKAANDIIADIDFWYWLISTNDVSVKHSHFPIAKAIYDAMDDEDKKRPPEASQPAERINRC